MKHLLFLLLLPLMIQAQQKTNPMNQNEELGAVSWHRNYDEAIQLSKDQNKPILMLFQEVPGCATCRNYGHNVLSHPLMVEAIENLFIPLAIFNNKEGEDAKILQKFNEPSWNNPVVRVINAKGEDLVDRVAGNYSVEGLYQAMEHVLLKEQFAIPAFMQVLGDELTVHPKDIKEAYYKMYCFWSGEGHLGQADGVLSTEAGFMDGHEVVKVHYDEKVLDTKTLTQHAQKAKCTPITKDDSYRIDKDPQYYLKQTDYKYLPLTNLQKTKINTALSQKKTAEKYLSPQQVQWLNAIQQGTLEKQERYTQDFVTAWKQLKSL